jgi:Flp pilus assembly protein TadG
MNARSLGKADGQTLMEFALALPLLALILFGIIQWGLILNASLYLRHGMHVGARSAAILGTSDQDRIRSIVCTNITPILNPARLGTVTAVSNTVNGVNAVQVSGSYGLPLIINFVVPGQVGNTYTLFASATYRTN